MVIMFTDVKPAEFIPSVVFLSVRLELCYGLDQECIPLPPPKNLIHSARGPGRRQIGDICDIYKMADGSLSENAPHLQKILSGGFS